jgi:taurine transport system permease protein
MARLQERLISVAVVSIILIAWGVVSNLGLFSGIILPSPGKAAASFVRILDDGYRGISLARHLADSMYRSLLSAIEQAGLKQSDVGDEPEPVRRTDLQRTDRRPFAGQARSPAPR